MNATPTFSIILITRNRPIRLLRAMESVRAQSFGDWELIIVDEASTPPVCVGKSSGVAGQVRLVRHATPRGPAGARARGAAVARGEVLCFLDDDDFYLPEHLAAIDRLRRRDCPPSAQLFCTGLLREDQHGRNPVALPFATAADQLLAYWQAPVGLPPFAVARAALVACPIPVGHSVIEDFEWLCLLLAKYRICSTPQPTVVYTVDPRGRTLGLVDRASLHQRESVLTKLYAVDLIRRRISQAAYLRQRSHQCWHWTRQAARAGHPRDAWWGFLRGLRALRGGSLREMTYTLYVLLRGRR